jgi:hypothetical protein
MDTPIGLPPQRILRNDEHTKEAELCLRWRLRPHTPEIYRFPAETGLNLKRWDGG